MLIKFKVSPLWSATGATFTNFTLVILRFGVGQGDLIGDKKVNGLFPVFPNITCITYFEFNQDGMLT